MRVMLTRDVENVGRAGEVKTVADGYGRNYLIPRRLAVVARKGMDVEARRIREAADRREARSRIEAQEVADEIGNRTVVVRLKVGAEDRVFGAVTNQDIAQALQQQHQVEIDHRRIELREPIKQLGEHQVKVRLHRDVEANVNLIVTKDR
jgi:large subunit ribosomal protein L9